mgnify:CR=1 FL=1
MKRDLQPHTLPVLKHIPLGVLEALGATSLHFPSVSLPFAGATQQQRSSNSSPAPAQHLHLPAGSPFATTQHRASYSTALGRAAGGGGSSMRLRVGPGTDVWAHVAATTTAFRAASTSTWHASRTSGPIDSVDAHSDSESPAADAPNSAARAATAAALRHSKPQGATGTAAEFAVDTSPSNVSFGPEGQALADGTGTRNTPADACEDALPELEFQLWGLTLGVTSDLLALTHSAQQVPLNWPPLRLPGALPSAIAWAVWGYMEVRDYPRYGVHPRHLAAAAVLATGIAAGVATGVYTAAAAAGLV